MFDETRVPLAGVRPPKALDGFRAVRALLLLLLLPYLLLL